MMVEKDSDEECVPAGHGALTCEESCTSDGFMSALTRAYNIHQSEVTALRNDLQIQHALTERQEETIQKLKCHIQRMKQAVKSAKAKIKKEVSVQRKLTDLLQQHNIMLPFKLSGDSSNSDEEEDCIIIDQSAVGEHSNPCTAQLSTSVDLTTPTRDDNEKDVDLITPTRDDNEKDVFTNPAHRPYNTQVKEKERKKPDLKGALRLHAAQKPSRIKYRDVNKDDVCMWADDQRGKCDPMCAVSQNGSNPDCSQSSSPSPSLLCVPNTTWQLVHNKSEHTDTNTYNSQGSKAQGVVSTVPPGDSQFSLDVSQSIPQSLELLPPSLSPTILQRKRNHCEAFPDQCEPFLSSHSHIHHNMPQPEHSKPTPPVFSSTQVVHDNTQQSPLTPSTVGLVFPKTPGIRAVSSAVVGDNTFFNGVQQDTKVPTSSHCDCTTAPFDTSTIAPGTSDSHQLQRTDTDSDVTHLNEDVEEPVSIAISGISSNARMLAAKAGLPNYKCSAVIRNRFERKKLDGQECPECKAWYSGDDGIYRSRIDHLKHTCRHKLLYQRQDTDPKMWDISFPDTEECEQLLNRPGNVMDI